MDAGMKTGDTGSSDRVIAPWWRARQAEESAAQRVFARRHGLRWLWPSDDDDLWSVEQRGVLGVPRAPAPHPIRGA